ncbi:MAG TPA: nucleoside transporter C-terminal domain-containing protein [Prolixibacteraceae bacterium]|nr:nucleoside transporter C-terminal domain-containing protein [Prolixibacteraceae bacterium]HPR60470.1 nucleoside transporter C-terminal domain-containing protein [Prolixibacteraceae bacterium]
MKKLVLLVLFVGAVMLLGAQDTLPVNTVVEQVVETEVVQQQTVDKSSILISEGSNGFSLISFLRGLLGIVVLLALGWIFSNNKKAIPWKTVFVGLALQILLAVGILNVPFVRWIFEFFGKIFVVILDFTKEGTNFLFEGFLDVDKFGYVFAFQVLPTIIFFSALTSVLFYFGVIQIVVKGLAYVFSRLMGLSGAEALSVAGNIFLGQTESPLMIKGYLSSMSDSEMLLVMSGGMATLAGGVLAAYIAMLGGNDPVLRLEFAKHLLTASVMAAPGAIIFSKMVFPPKGEVNKMVDVSKDKFGDNPLEAITTGTSEGIKLAVNVAGMLLAFIAFIAMFNFVLRKVGGIGDINESIAQMTGGRYDRLSLQFVLGYLFSPVMWLIGVPLQDITLVGRLLGEKLIMTEFIGYISLADMKESGIFSSPKSIIMATYVLCGFANFASIGIQIGGIGSLVPEKRTLLSKLGLRALWVGTLASLLSATIIGMIMG